jgi:hypothetical protein
MVECFTLCMFERLSDGVVLITSLSQPGSAYCVCVLPFNVFVSSDRRHTVAVPTISTTDAMSISHRCLPFPVK